MQVRIDKNQLDDTQAMLKGLSLDGPKILTRALNKTVRRGQKRASEEIRKQVSLKAAYVKKKLYVNPANYKKLSASLSAQKRGVLMTQYPFSVLKRGGVTVKIKRNEKRARLPGAFLTQVNAGARRVDVVAIPDNRGGRYATGNRKMKVLYSPSVSQIFNTVRDDIDRELLEFLDLTTDKEISTVLRGY